MILVYGCVVEGSVGDMGLYPKRLEDPKPLHFTIKVYRSVDGSPFQQKCQFYIQAKTTWTDLQIVNGIWAKVVAYAQVDANQIAQSDWTARAAGIAEALSDMSLEIDTEPEE